MTPSGKSVSPKKPSAPSSWRRVRGIHLASIVATALIAHGLCLGASFYMDDQPHILNSQRISAAPEDSGGIVARSWAAVPGFYHTGQRFVAYLLWNAIYETVGFNAAAYHALNLLLHTVTALLLFATARELLENHSRRSRETFPPGRTALVAALVFAAHPICSEITNYAAQTTIALVTLFSLLASYCTLRWLGTFRWRWALGAAAAFILAALSKEPGIFHVGLNGLLILIVLAPFRFLVERAGKHFKLILAGAIPLLAAVLYIALRQDFFARAFATFTDPQYLGHVLTQSRVFWEYLQRIVLPLNLCSDHLVPRTVSAGDTIAWIAAAGLLLLLVATALAFRKGHRILALLSALALSHLLLRFIDLSPEVMVEYRTYPSMPWFALLGALLLNALFRRHRSWGTRVTAALVTVLAILSLQRSTVWKSEASIAKNIIAQYPLHIRSQFIEFRSMDAGDQRSHNVIERQKTVQKNLNTILDFNRNKAQHHRGYDPGKSLAGFMLGEQLVGYALIDLGHPEEAAARMTEVIEKMRVFFENDNSRAFGVLYRARGKAKAALGDTAGARADYEACLQRKPLDTETPRLLKELDE